MEKRFEAPLKLAIQVLEDNGYRYALIGGLVLAQWGKVRVTKDIDIKVLVPDLDYKKIRCLLISTFQEPARPNAPQNQLIVGTIINDVIVDFLLAIPGYEELIIERAIQVDMDGWKVWICSAEDLIIQKMVAGREKDLEDVLSVLIVRQRKLDHAYIDHWLIQFAEALDDPGMLTRYKELEEKAANIETKYG